MVKTIITVGRAEHLTPQEFVDAWHRLPPPPQSLHYILSDRIGDADGNAPYDGFASVWTEDETAAAAAVQFVTDQLRDLVDPRSVIALSVDELVQRDVPVESKNVKLVFFMVRKQGSTKEQFREHWLNVHGPLAMKHIAALRRYVQNHVRDTEYDKPDGPAYDGVVEGWQESIEALRQTETSSEHQFVRSDEPNFMEADQVTYMAVTEHVVR